MNRKTVLYLVVAVTCIAFSRCTHENSDRSEKDLSDNGIPVSVDTVKVATLYGYTVAYGTVEPDPGTMDVPAAHVRITAPADGVIARVNCAENRKVSAGDTLFVFDTTLSDAAVEKARSDFSTAEKAFDRQKQMRAIDVTSDRQYLEAQQRYESMHSALSAAQMERALLDVRAPIQGTLTHIEVRAGETVNAADKLAEIMDYRHLTVTAKVSAEEAGNVATGQPAFISTSMAQKSDSVTVKGAVRYVSGQINPLNGSVEVVVTVPTDAPLRPGQFVYLEIAHAVHTDCLAVPSESVVIADDGQASVAVVEGDEAVVHAVRPGLMDGGLTEILDSDLTPGMMVVVTGAYGLPDHASVYITNR